MALVFLDGVCVYTTQNINRSQTNLPLSPGDTTMILNALGTEGHTYFTLTARTGVEIVKLYNNNGKVGMERGQSGTEPVSASAGTCLCFRINKAILDEYMQGLFEPCQTTIISDDLEVTPPAEDECEWKINFTQDFKDRLDGCCPEGDCPECNVVDGTYENATITIRNGRICEISQGRNIVYTGGACCSCGDNNV